MMEFVRNKYTEIRRDTQVNITDTHFIKTRRQKVGKTTYIVSSYYDLDAKESTIDRLKSLMLHDLENGKNE